MILKNKKLLLITSLLTLLPIPIGLLLWNRFPETIAIHYGITGQADGFSSVPYAVFVPPLLILAVHWLCILATALDKSNKERNQKLQSIVLWIIPLISNLCSGCMFALALGWEFSPVVWTLVPMGILFTVIGNYLPKTRMNATMGIKIYWTYTSEENWNATHRIAGKLWVIGGILMLFCSFLPHGWAVAAMFGILLFMVLIPVVYSRRFYKKELAEGKELTPKFYSKNSKSGKLSIVFLVLLLIFVGFVMFFGEIDYVFSDDYLIADTNMYSDNILYYDAVESVEFREGNVPGLRVGGFGSFRLLLGFFENEEFGTYIRYTYYNPEACVVVHLNNQILVLSGETQEETTALYQELLARIK